MSPNEKDALCEVIAMSSGNPAIGERFLWTDEPFPLIDRMTINDFRRMIENLGKLATALGKALRRG